MTDTLTLTRPDDWHLHLRDGAQLAAVLPDTARQFARAIVMPNLKPPVTTTDRAAAYRQPLLDQLAESGASGLLSANLGCRIHLAGGTPATVEHPLALLLRLARIKNPTTAAP